MNKSEFLPNLIDYSKEQGFSLLLPGEGFEDSKRVSSGKQTLAAVAAGAVFGLVGTLATGYLDKTQKRELVADLGKMQDYCGLIGIKLSDGPVRLRLGIDADDISGETLVGRFAMIHERTYDFRKYSPSVMRTIWNDGKLATVAQVVVAFSAHKRAKEFIENFAENVIALIAIGPGGMAEPSC